jgi:hypothetical protein
VTSTADVFQRSKDFKGLKDVHLSVTDVYQLVLLDTSVCKQIVKLFKKEHYECQLSYGKIIKRVNKFASLGTDAYGFPAAQLCAELKTQHTYAKSGYQTEHLCMCNGDYCSMPFTFDSDQVRQRLSCVPF